MPRGFANANVGLDEARTSPLWKSEWGKGIGERSHVFETEEPLFEGPRLAPMFQDKEYGKIHEKAKQRILDEDSRAQASDEFTLAQKELKKAPQSTYHHDIRQKMEGIFNNPLEYHKKFMKPYDDVIDDMNIEAEKQFIEKHLPRLEGRAIMSGTFRSPQHLKSKERFTQDYLAQLNRDKKKLRMDANERAWNTANNFLGQNQNYLGTAAQMAVQDREGHIKQAQAHMGLDSEKTKLESARADILRGQAEREQAQRQREYEEAYTRHQEPIERRKRNLERESAIFANTPQTGENIRQYLPQGGPPLSPASVGAASLFTMADMMRGKPHKKGGRALSLIDQKFKKGGKVSYLAEGGSPFHQSDEQIGFNSPELEMLREQSKKKHSEDPTSSYLSTMAGNLWKNLRNPAEGFGEGMLKGTEAYHAAHERNRVNEHRQAALWKGIEDSRQKQKSLLAEYEQKKLDSAETNRHNLVTESHQGLLNKSHAKYYDKLTALSGDLTGSSPPLTAQQQKVMDDVQSKVSKYANIYNLAENTQKSLSKVDSGPIVGNIANLPSYGVGSHLSAFLGAGTPEDIENAKGQSNDLLTALRDAQKSGGKSVSELMQRIQGKPDVNKFPEFNKEKTEKLKNEFKKEIELELNRARRARVPEIYLEPLKQLLEKNLSSEKQENEESKISPNQSSSESNEKYKEKLKAAIAAKKAERGIE